MKILAHSHTSIVDQVAGAVVRSATNHTVGALMRGHALVGVIVIAIALFLGLWAVNRLF